MNFSRPRILRKPLTPFSSCMSSSSKSTSHYVTLKVDQDATQEEIKAAYYKLTKQYHPDMNKSEEAKEKFRNVSEAYEVLGNYKTRKQYDRGIIARGITRSSEKDEKNIPHMAFYKSRMDKYPKPVKTSNSKIYDFDAWTRAHYGSTLKKTIKRRADNKEFQEYRDNIAGRRKEREMNKKTSIIVILVLICSILLLEVRDNFDIVATNEEKSVEKSKS